MEAVRESSKELMARLVQTLLDEGQTAETFDLDSMPFAQMEQLGHGVGKELARQIQGALAEAQAARMNEQHGAEYACPQCGQTAGKTNSDCELPQSRRKFSRWSAHPRSL